MADIVDSSKYPSKKLATDFKMIVTRTNKDHPGWFLSPLTITLGDEFQGVATDLAAAVKAIFALEETIITLQKGFKLRYVVVEGVIDTPINPDIAYEMMGAGLTNARTMLNELKKSKSRFNVDLKDKRLKNILNNAYLVAQGFIDDWRAEKDYAIISGFLVSNDYKVVADKLSKDRSQIWKKAKTLKIASYLSIKEVINYLGGTK